MSHWLLHWWEGGLVSQTGSQGVTSSKNIWFNCSNKRRYSVFHCYSSCVSAMGVYSNSAWCLRPAKSLWRNAERWSAWLSLGVCVFVFQCVKPLGLNIAGILSLFPPFFPYRSLTLSAMLSPSLFFSWLWCHCGEGNSDPIVNGGKWAAGQWCHPAIGKNDGNALLAFRVCYFFLLFSGRRWSI